MPSEAIKRSVWINAGGRCCICKTRLNWANNLFVNIGEVAHIVGQGSTDSTPRRDPHMEPDEIDALNNLMLLCPNDHRAVDGRLEAPYTAEVLRRRKADHELRVEVAIQRAFGNVRAAPLRLTGPVQGEPVSIASGDAIAAVISHGGYPIGGNRHDYLSASVALPTDIDDPSAFRSAATLQIQRRVNELRTGYEAGEFDTVSVFAFADVPSLIQLGHTLNELPIEPFQRNPHTGEWTWQTQDATASFTHTDVQSAAGGSEVVVACDISGTVDTTTLPWAQQAMPHVRILPESGSGDRNVIKSSLDLQALRQTTAYLIGELERVLLKPITVHLVGPLPVSAAVTLGNVFAHRGIETIVTYRFDGRAYAEDVRL